MKITIRTLYFIFCAFVIMHICFGQESFWKSDVPNKKARIEYAKKLMFGFQKLNSQIPNLSPSEKEWLDKEYYEELERSGNILTKRAIRAMDSDEYQILIAKPTTENILRSLHKITKNEDVSLEYEVNLWTHIVYLLMDYTYWQTISALVDRGIIDSRINDIDDLYYKNHVLWSQTILEKITLPFFNGNLQDK